MTYYYLIVFTGLNKDNQVFTGNYNLKSGSVVKTFTDIDNVKKHIKKDLKLKDVAILNIITMTGE